MTSMLPLDDLHTIAQNLAAGFETLLQQLVEQQNTELHLRAHLEQISKNYGRKAASGNSSSIEIGDWRDEIVKQISQPSLDTGPTTLPEKASETLQNARTALQQLQNHSMPIKTEVRKCPISHKIPDQEDFERDFTVPGKPSDLRCPFAKPGSGLSPVVADPIAAEFHGDKSSTRSQDAGSRCPIRFLDQHSPEEVAQYFENHKHEIPRSHQICVKRYQQNEQSIRQLDAKYGNLVSMIQGLGNKHKQYLPEDEKVADQPEEGSNQAVEKWAENVSQSDVVNERGREPQSEKPLRDIRVGESPSRPWGIPVPVNKSLAASVSPSVNAAHEQSAKPPSSVPAPVISRPTAVDEQADKNHKVESTSTKPQIIFNGPVFFGYSPEQAAVFLQHLNISSTR